MTDESTYSPRIDDDEAELKRLKARRGHKRGRVTTLAKRVDHWLKAAPQSVTASTIDTLTSDINSCIEAYDDVQLAIDECALDPDSCTPTAERELHNGIHESYFWIYTSYLSLPRLTIRLRPCGHPCVMHWRWSRP